MGSNFPKEFEMSQYLTIKEASVEFGLSLAWVRRMCHKDLVEYRRVQVGNTRVKRIEILRSSLESRVTQGRSRRDDGRGKFTLYCTPEELVKVREVLKESGIESPLRRANPRKGVETPKELNPLASEG
jgi:hypothetical protein